MPACVPWDPNDYNNAITMKLNVTLHISNATKNVMICETSLIEETQIYSFDYFFIWRHSFPLLSWFGFGKNILRELEIVMDKQSKSFTNIYTNKWW